MAALLYYTGRATEPERLCRQKAAEPHLFLSMHPFTTRDRTGHPVTSVQFTDCRIPGCVLVDFPSFRDHRGLFVKSFQHGAFERRGLDCDFKESFYTESGENVLRGMHFQVPPADHAKLVYCMSGEIWDIALDLRIGSPTYGEYEAYDLRAGYNNAAYLPRGIAHGFFVRSAPAMVVYQVTSEYSPAHDVGIHWNSFGAPWPCSAPVISERDQAHVRFADFESPFLYETPAEIEAGNEAARR